MEKPNKRRADLERTRQIILSVASELFMIKGFESISTHETALRTNITQPSLYHYFRNKKELYLVVVEELMSRVKEELVPIVSGNASVEEKLYQSVKALLDEHPTNLFLMLNDTSQEMGPDYNCTLHQIFKKTYISDIAAISKNEPGISCLQEDVSVDDVTQFILYNVSTSLGTEKTYQRKTVDDSVKEFTQFMLHGIPKGHK